MRRKLSKHGNSLALVIEKPVLELLGITADTELEVTTDGRKLTVVAATDEEREARFEQALNYVFEEYDEALRKLAE
jgi:putative addiction module antidote